MKAKIIKKPENLKEDPKLLSAPVIETPLYQCAASVTVLAFEPKATIEVDVSGTVTSAPGGFPLPDGVTIKLPANLVAGQKVRARQKVGAATSPWTASIVVGDHTKDFPAGPPRPEINPAPVYKCGVRTGVSNLLPGGHVWITAAGAKVGDVDGCAATQGVNVSPAYGANQKVQAFFELCKDPSPPSVELMTQTPPAPLPAPTVDPTYAGGQSVTVRNIVNGAKVTIFRNGANLGTWPCWGGSLIVNGLATFVTGDVHHRCRAPSGRTPAKTSPAPAPLKADGIPTLVLNATTDPATPYSNAQAVASRLADGYLVTEQGGPHVIFGWGVACVDDLVTAFLVSDQLPSQAQTVCPGEVSSAYVDLPPLSAAATASSGDPLPLLAAVDDDFYYIPEYYYWDQTTPTTVGCPEGGTWEFEPLNGGEAYTLNDCAFSAGFIMTGNGTYNSDQGLFSLNITVKGLARGSLSYTRDSNDTRRVTGDYAGKAVDTSR